MACPTSRLREVEVHRYYQPWSQQFQSQPETVLELPPVAPPNQLSVRSSYDKALTSFAQLGCLRLKVKRGIVTLIDDVEQYILAEATQTMSLMDNATHGWNDELWFGSASIPRDQGISPDVFTAGKYVAEGPGQSPYEANALVIPDVTTHPKYAGRAYAGKGVRFYAGVPIMSHTGLAIGVYTVTDDQPRSGLAPDELRFMVDMAAVVMEHLQTVQNNRARTRGDNLIQGISQFVEGKHSTSPFTRRKDSRQLTLDSLSLDDDTDVGSNPVDQDARISANDGGPTREDNEAGALTEISRGGDTIVTAGSGIDDRGAQPNRALDSFGSELLHRAATILRNCTNADGTVIIDASSVNLGDATSTKTEVNRGFVSVEHSRQEGRQHRYATTSGESNLEVLQERRLERATADDSVVDDQACQILALDLVHPNSQPPIQISERTLSWYIDRYPKGNCFMFDEHGKPTSDEDESGSKTSDSPNPVERQSNDLERPLLKSPSDARSIVFLPLWDVGKERWHSCIIIWSRDKYRLMNVDQDLAYLTAFGNAVMTEMAASNLKASDAAKTTFLASINHELRTPIHGIAGGLEFLHSTELDTFQVGLLVSVERSCRTLLDTVNHVLDYSKVMNMSKDSRLKIRNTSAWRLPGQLEGNLTQDVDLIEVLEDAVEAVFAGQVFHDADDEAFKLRDTSTSTSMANHVLEKRQALRDRIKTSQAKLLEPVQLTLSIEHYDNWRVISQPGAVARLVTNLLGNSLKYTSNGAIHVSLGRQHSENPDPTHIDVVLSVKDTGKGMSEDFLRNHAFTAFRQEDSFSQGNGLGLSIVRQIVDAFEGRITLQSRLGWGTEATVWLRLPSAPRVVSDEPSSIPELHKFTRDMSLCLLDPLWLPALAEQKPSREGLPTIADSISVVASEWFGMRVMHSQNMTNVTADVFVYAEPPPIEYLMEHHGQHDVDSEIPVIIACENPVQAASLHANGIHQLTDIGRILEIVAQPVGPHKLAKVLHRCLVRTSKLERRSGAASDRPVSPTVSTWDRVPHLKPSRRSAGAGGASKIQHPDEDDVHTENAMTEGNTRAPKVSQVTIDDESKTTQDKHRHRNLETFGQKRPGTPVDLDKPAVLIVDDNKINLQLLNTFSRKLGYPHESVDNGLKAFEAYKQSCMTHSPEERFKFVLMDISMPVWDGFQATQAIRNFERANGVQPQATIIALTGMGVARAEALQYGFDELMAKPVRFRDLQKYLHDQHRADELKRS